MPKPQAQDVRLGPLQQNSESAGEEGAPDLTALVS